MSDAARAAPVAAAVQRQQPQPAPSARERERQGAPVDNMTVARMAAQGSGGLTFPGPPLGNQDELRRVQLKRADGSVRGGAPARCSACEERARHAGVQAKCAPCEARTRAPAVAPKCETCDGAESQLVDVARPALADAEGTLPHLGRIQASFGRHDLSQVRTQTGGIAREANEQIGARAFTAGDRIAFRETPDAWLAAHESAHVIQQREGRSPADGVAGEHDAWEQHADRVADTVVAGRSAEPLLDEVAGGERAPTPPVQLDGEKGKADYSKETKDQFAERVKSAAAARLTQNIAALGKWSSYVSSMEAFQLRAQLLTGKLAEYAGSASLVPGGEKKLEQLVGTQDWGQRSYLEAQLKADANYHDTVWGWVDSLRTKSFGYYTTPSMAQKSQVLTGDRPESALPEAKWVPPDFRYAAYADTLTRLDKGEIHSGCQFCHEINHDVQVTIEKYGDWHPEGDPFLTPKFVNDEAALKTPFKFASSSKSTHLPPATDNAEMKVLVDYMKSMDAATPSSAAGTAGGTPAGYPKVVAPPAASTSFTPQNPFLPATEIPATVVTPPPRTNLCGSLPESKDAAPVPKLSAWGPNSAIVADVLARVNAVLMPLGPRGYRVLPAETFDQLWSMTPDNTESVRQSILDSIAARITGYIKLRGDITGGSVPYEELCPIVDELAPSTNELTRVLAMQDVRDQQLKEKILGITELILVGLSFIFPPAQIVTVPTLAALGLVRAGLGFDQMRQGGQWSEGVGAGVYSPQQEAEAASLEKRGMFNVVGGLFSAVTNVASVGSLASAESSLVGKAGEGVSVIKTPAGYMVTHADYPGVAVWIEGNAVEVMNDAGEVVAHGVLYNGQFYMRAGAPAAAAAGEAGSTSTALVPFGSNAMVPYASNELPFFMTGAAPTPATVPFAAAPLAPLALPPGPQPFGLLPPGPQISPRPFTLAGPNPRATSFLLAPAPGAPGVNYFGQPVVPYAGHIGSPLDPAMSARPAFRQGPFTDAQRQGFLAGNDGGTMLTPHHRHQLSVTQSGGIIDELPRAGHPEGNVHLTGPRHPGPSYFRNVPGGEALRQDEITAYWQAKAARLIQVGPNQWIDPGP